MMKIADARTVATKISSLQEAIQQSRTETINEMNQCLETVSENLSSKICESCQKNVKYTDIRIDYLRQKQNDNNELIFDRIRNIKSKLETLIILSIFNSGCILAIVIYLASNA